LTETDTPMRSGFVTRAVMRGIAIQDNCQIIFVDTPGIFAPRRRLDEAMVTTAWGSARDADISVFLIDAERGQIA